MKRTRFGRRGGLSHDAEQLIWLATGQAQSGSRAEDRYWEARMTELVDALLDQDDEATLGNALDHLYSTEPRAYDELADLVEYRAESGTREDADLDVLVIAAPILAWSRFRIPAVPIPAAVLANLRVHLQAHVLAEGVKLAVADFLFSPDQLPQGYIATARLSQAMGDAACHNEDLHIDTEGLPETAQFLSDTRYILAAVAAPRGAPLFAWQQSSRSSRERALSQWRAQGGACLAPLLPGCVLDVVLPEAYFAASRHADEAGRPYSVRASVAFLGTALDAPASRLRAIVAPFYEQHLEEFRIGFTLQGDDKVVHGVVWPLLGAEDENSETGAQIEAVLKECGVLDILSLEHQFPVEFCDDCGAPLYPSPDGEVVHAEMPEDEANPTPMHLH
ncbi:MAG: DUF2863 family protein [Zoogloeaceae bacterium]|nr:DUF2863 family protein [Zoogloeaceae bacterium]